MSGRQFRAGNQVRHGRGISDITIEGQPAFIVDDGELCSPFQSAGVNCSNRGCDLRIWKRTANGRWSLILEEHSRGKFISATEKEGSVTGTMAKDINISGQEITFQCFGHDFRATCTSKGPTYQSTGGHRGLLRRGTFFKKRDWPFHWEP